MPDASPTCAPDPVVAGAVATDPVDRPDPSGAPVVVVRDKQGLLRAFVNVCRHRGSLVCEGEGRRETLQCPYHAWTYDLDGSLRTAPRSDREPDFDREGLGRPDDLVTTVIDTSDVRELRERAIRLHASQTSPFEGMPEDFRTAFLATDYLARLAPAWDGGAQETALL